MTIYEAISIALSIGALLASSFALYYSDQRSIRANALTEEANRKLDEANSISRKALDIDNFNYKTKIIPQLKVEYNVMYGSDKPEEPNIMRFVLINYGCSKSIIHKMMIHGSYRIATPINFPEELSLNQELKINISFGYRKEDLFTPPRTKTNARYME